MAYWLYKCNKRAPANGDWLDVFNRDGDVDWGDTTLKGVDQVKQGDVLLAFQTDRNELVGTALVKKMRPRNGRRILVIRAMERLGVKVRPLKEADAKIDKIPALSGGDIRTAYSITIQDAERILAAARKRLWTPSKGGQALPKSQKAQLLESFKELPVEERKAYLRLLRVVARTARLRSQVLRVWAPECAACGRKIADESGRFECEVAHVQDVHAAGLDLVANTVPLCRTHHWAFDRDLWGIHPTTLRINVKRVAFRDLKEIKGRTIRRPTICIGDIEPLAVKHLKWRWERFKA